MKNDKDTTKVEAVATVEVKTISDDVPKEIEISDAQKARAGRVIVRNLQFDMKEKHMRSYFEKYGKIIEVNLPIKPETGLNRGFGFVEFENKEQAQKAISAVSNT